MSMQADQDIGRLAKFLLDNFPSLCGKETSVNIAIKIMTAAKSCWGDDDSTDCIHGETGPCAMSELMHE